MRKELRRIVAGVLASTSALGAREYAALDGLRAWAVLMVWNVHYLDSHWRSDYGLAPGSPLRPIWATIHSGHVGVDLFFVLSGFIIEKTLRRRQLPLFAFMRRRYGRLLPAHLFVLLPLLVGALCQPHASLSNAAANVLLVQSLVAGAISLNFVTWSLGYEVLWYGLSALWVSAGRRVRGLDGAAAIAAVTVGLLAAQWWGLSNARVFGFVVPELSRFAGFVFGFAVARLHGEKARFRRAEPLLAALGVVAIGAVYYFRWRWTQETDLTRTGAHFAMLYYAGIDFAFALVVAAALCRGSLVERFFALPALVALGRISYSFYLVHALYGLPLGRAVEAWIAVGPLAPIAGARQVHQVQMIAGWLAGVAATTLIARLAFEYLERPYFVAAAPSSVGPFPGTATEAASETAA